MWLTSVILRTRSPGWLLWIPGWRKVIWQRTGCTRWSVTWRSKEIAGGVGYECDDDGGSLEGDGSGGGGAAAGRTWEKLWADVDRSGPDECGAMGADAGRGRQVAINGVQGDDVAAAGGVVGAENLSISSFQGAELGFWRTKRIASACLRVV